MDWFLYHNGLRHERVKGLNIRKELAHERKLAKGNYAKKNTIANRVTHQSWTSTINEG